MSGGELAGWRVLVTRPQEQAAPLCQLIAAHGGAAHVFPLLEIHPAQDMQRARAAFMQLARYQWIIFISANAVYQGWPFIAAAGGLPATLQVAAVGKATANAILAQGGRVDLIPQSDYSSEGLLATSPMQTVQGQAVLIVRGEGGKETLAITLRARGAQVEYAEVYRRGMPDRDVTVLCDASGKPVIDVISTSSGEALQHLGDMARAQHATWLFDLPLVVVHPRHVAVAKAAGFTRPPQVADNASDEAVVAAIIRAREQYHD